MGNCKSTSAAAADSGYAGASTVTTHKKPLVQIQIDGNVEVPHGTLVLSPTADLSEATSKDSHDGSNTGNPSTVVTRCSVDDWIGTKPTLDEEEEEEEEKEENEEAGDNGSDFDDGMPPPPPGKPDSASKPSSAVANPTYKFVVPFMSGTIPASILQIASDYVMSEVNALTPVAADGEKKSVWALDPTTLVAGATAALLGDDNAKASTEKTATTTTPIDAPFDEISVDGSDIDDEIDPAAVTIRYKQKASQWAVDEAVQGSLKRRGPRPEDSGISRRTLRR